MRDREFEDSCRLEIDAMGRSTELHQRSRDWFDESFKHRYSYHFSWLGLPIIQYPQDIVAMQELIWEVQPDLIVETGIARGGSLVFYASMLHLIGAGGTVVGVDVDIREHNREEIEDHPLFRYIEMIEGSSTDPGVVGQVVEHAKGRECVLVVLDSSHTHAHVAHELSLYSPLVTRGSYLVVFDTCVERLPDHYVSDRLWGRGDNPWTAVHEFLADNDRFEIDHHIVDKLQITVAPDGYLRCVKD
jgi:cephalosporin hydroxylase